jgi:hypothetical protein
LRLVRCDSPLALNQREKFIASGVKLLEILGRLARMLP